MYRVPLSYDSQLSCVSSFTSAPLFYISQFSCVSSFASAPSLHALSALASMSLFIGMTDVFGATRSLFLRKQPHVNVYPISPHESIGPATIIKALKKNKLQQFKKTMAMLATHQQPTPTNNKHHQQTTAPYLNTTAIKQFANNITPNCKNKKMWQKKRKIQLPAVVTAAPAMETPNLVSMSCTLSFLVVNALPA